jgi:CheY-like chemotaxis protein
MSEQEKVVLIVDDDQALRETICEVLEDEGYRAVGVTDGEQALRYLNGAPRPCAILLDLMMPKMNGWQFRAAQQRDPELAAIRTAVMTANSNIEGAPIDADHFLWKPLRLDDLLRFVKGCCGGG